MSQPIVTDNPEATRFEAHIDGRLAGFAEYQLTCLLYTSDAADE